MDLEDLVEAGDREDLEDAVVLAHEPHRPAAGAGELQPADEHPEAGRVEERHLGEVDDETGATTDDLLVELLAHERSRVHVDLTAEVHHGLIAAVGSPARDIHLQHPPHPTGARVAAGSTCRATPDHPTRS